MILPELADPLQSLGGIRSGAEIYVIGDRLVARVEGCVATVRHPELREAQVGIREQVDEVLTDLLERCGRAVRVPQLHTLVVVVDGAVLCGLGDLDPDPRALARTILLDVMHTVAPPAEP